MLILFDRLYLYYPNISCQTGSDCDRRQIADAKAGNLTTEVIRWFVGRYGVNMDEAANSGYRQLPEFNEFYPTAERRRPPVCSRFHLPGMARSASSAKSRRIRFPGQGGTTTDHGVGWRGPPSWHTNLKRATFATLYLSPKDYHRIHMPCDGRPDAHDLRAGELFLVNPTTARGVPLGCSHATSAGMVYCVRIGAWPVCTDAGWGDPSSAGMATTWRGVVNPPRVGRVREWQYADRSISLHQGR